MSCVPDALGETYSRSFALSCEQRRSGSDVLVLATLLSEGDPCDEARDIDYVLTFSDEGRGHVDETSKGYGKYLSLIHI